MRSKPVFLAMKFSSRTKILICLLIIFISIISSVGVSRLLTPYTRMSLPYLSLDSQGCASYQDTHRWFGSDRAGKCLPKDYTSKYISVVKDKATVKTVIERVELHLPDSLNISRVYIFFKGLVSPYISEAKFGGFEKYSPNDVVVVTVVERVVNEHVFDVSGKQVYVFGGKDWSLYVERIEKRL